MYTAPSTVRATFREVRDVLAAPREVAASIVEAKQVQDAAISINPTTSSAVHGECRAR